MEGLTRSAAVPFPSRLTLRFPNRELEQAFQHGFADEALLKYRYLTGLVLVIWLGFGLLDHRIASGDALVNARIVRYAMVAPVLLGNMLLGFAPRRIFQRFWQLALAVGFACIAAAMLRYISQVPEDRGPGGIAGLALVIVGGYTLVMMRFVYAFPVSIAVTVIAALQQSGTHVNGEAATVLTSGLIWVYVANVIGIVACRDLESFRRHKFVQRLQLELEQDRSEALLLNVLPRSIAERLKRADGRVVDRFESVTVLFADIVGFTELAEKLRPEELVELLNDFYSELDDIAERHGLEKIKTVGDAYMVVGGAPVPRDDHAEAVAAMALEMLEVVDHERRGGHRLQIRIGIHTGPVVAGVIGTRKFAYDVWGDTVNIASRLQSHGVSGAIQLSQKTRDLLGEVYEFEERGRLELKGKGETTAYLLKRRAAS